MRAHARAEDLHVEGAVIELFAEQALVDANRELIMRFEQMIQATLARIWGRPVEQPKR